nr:hypothetical protein [Thiomonas sp. X19]
MTTANASPHAVDRDDCRSRFMQQFSAVPVARGRSVPRTQRAWTASIVALRWGLMSSRAKDPTIGNRLINAWSETAANTWMQPPPARMPAILEGDDRIAWLDSPNILDPLPSPSIA